MPVPVIPICAISMCLPRPILEYQTPICPPPPEPLPYPIPPAPSNLPCPPEIIQLEILNYPPIETPPVGVILTNTTGSTPAGYYRVMDLKYLELLMRPCLIQLEYTMVKVMVQPRLMYQI